MKYTPLNLSFLSHNYSPQQDQIRSTARMIMANAGWSEENQRNMQAAMTAARKQENSLHKQTFLSSVFDLLQTPLYGVANALDEALAGHQESNSDSVASDIAKTAEGAVKGLVMGVGGGLRGATGLVDALPGIDINDEFQSDPLGKTHFSDVAIRQLTHMSSGDAMKPENWDKVKGKLEAANAKSVWSKTFPELFIPNNLDNPDASKKFFRNEALGGIVQDIGADPLNLILPGVGALRKGAKAAEGLTEGLGAARAAEGTTNAIKDGLAAKNTNFTPKGPIGSLPFKPVAEGADEIAAASGPSVNIANVSQIGDKGNFKTLAKLGRREEAPIQGVAVSSRDQHNLVWQILNLAKGGEKNWHYKAAQLLLKHPHVTWTDTEKLIQKAGEVTKKIGHRGVEGLAPALRKTIYEDVSKARPAGEVADVERRVSNLPGEVKGAAVLGGKIVPEGAGKVALKVAEARLANRIVTKLEKEILGTDRPTGTGTGLAINHARGINSRLSGPQQARIWNFATSNLENYSNAYKKYDKATRITRAVLNYFQSKGVQPISGTKIKESVPLRLDHVAEAIGPDALAKSHAFITGILRGDPKALAHLTPEQLDSLRNVRANEALHTAPVVSKGIDISRNLADVISKAPVSVPRRQEMANQAIKDVKNFVLDQGGGAVGAHVSGEYLGNLLGKGDPIGVAISTHRLKTEAWLGKVGKDVKTGIVNDPNFLKSVNNAISKAARLPSPKQLSGAIGAAARVQDWLGARFNAAYGIQDMNPILRREQASAMSTTGRRAKLFNALGKRFPPSNVDLWHEAFRTAQRNGIASGEVAALQSEIAKAMENLVGGTGLRSGAIADSTVVGRSRLLLEELNQNMKRFGLSKYEFVAGKVKDADGVEHDLSKGMDWMRSWETWNVKNPYEFLHRFQNVVEHTVHEKNMFDEIASRWGSTAKKGPVKYGVDHPRLRGYFFTEEAAQQAKTFVRMLDEISTPNSKALQYFDHVLSKIKAGLTIYGGMAGHQITNLIGDTYYNWIAGVTKPIRAEQAIKVMASQKGRYGDFATFDKLTGPKALEQSILRSVLDPAEAAKNGLNVSPAGNQVIVTMRNGTKVTADMIATAAHREGIMPVARVLEDITSDVTSPLDKIGLPGKYRGTIQHGVHTISELRDHLPRYMQFIDGIAKHNGSFTSAVEASARNVRKWHPDGLDLTNFEKKVMKRVFPFYSWTRKAIPLSIEATLFHGNKVMAYPRLMEAIGMANGIDPNQAVTDPFPSDQLFPDWLRERGIGPISGGPGNYSVFNPSTPILDILAQIGNPGQTAISNLNPMGKVPIEVMQSQTLGSSGAPIQTNQQWADYATKQIPVVSGLGRASGVLGVSGSTRSEGFPNYTNILNLLTGLKKVDTGKYQKSSQFDLRDYFKQKAQQQFR